MTCSRWLTLSVLTAVLGFASAARAADSEAVYELRTYTAAPGKFDALESRFRDHTDKLFRKHGLEAIGYWKPVDGPKAEDTLIYVIKHKDRDTAKSNWAAFAKDPEWQAVASETQKDGRLVTKVESIYMKPTDYSPPLDMDAQTSGKERLFELRTYTTNDDKLDDLHARFRDHTDKLFRKQGLNSVAYWTPLDEPKSENTLIYILWMDDQDAAKKGWQAFLNDPDWKVARDKSEEDGPILSAKPDSVYMKATDYSPIR